MLTAALVLAMALPALGGVLVSVLPARPARATATCFAIAAAALGIWAVATDYPDAYRRALGDLPWLGEQAGHGLLGVLLDPLSSILLLIVVVVGLLTVVYSVSYLSDGNRDHPVGPQDQGRYYFWLLLFVASMVGVAVSPNFLQLFVFWELTTLCSWALISFYRNDKSLRAGLKALIMTHVGGLFFLLALLVLFVQTGSFEFAALARLSEGERTWVFCFLMIAAWAKAAQVPMHTWLPDAMEAPTPISAYLHAAAMVKAGVYLMARSVSASWSVLPNVAYVLGAMAVLTILVALSFYFVQDDLKRLLAYSTIAHLGYVLLGAALGALGSIEGFRGGVLHIICHGFSKGLLFFCVGAVAYVTGTRSISTLRGLGRTMPLTATAFFIGLLAVTGIPPFACFWSKFMLLAGAVDLGGSIGPVLLVVLLGETLIAFAWMLFIGQEVFLGAPSPAAQVNSDPPLAMRVTLLLLMIACVVAPAAGIPLVELIGR
ncbi:MAG: hypothetical protein GTO22_17505 [Gemmatimonadales bacterium]|nr:hypothetical protein [Gemmatimonadales bacterium]